MQQIIYDGIRHDVVRAANGMEILIPDYITYNQTELDQIVLEEKREERWLASRRSRLRRKAKAKEDALFGFIFGTLMIGLPALMCLHWLFIGY